jgi:hypothetical protein
MSYFILFLDPSTIDSIWSVCSHLIQYLGYMYIVQGMKYTMNIQGYHTISMTVSFGGKEKLWGLWTNKRRPISSSKVHISESGGISGAWTRIRCTVLCEVSYWNFTNWRLEYLRELHSVLSRTTDQEYRCQHWCVEEIGENWTTSWAGGQRTIDGSDLLCGIRMFTRWARSISYNTIFEMPGNHWIGQSMTNFIRDRSMLWSHCMVGAFPGNTDASTSSTHNLRVPGVEATKMSSWMNWTFYKCRLLYSVKMSRKTCPPKR